MSCSRMLGLLCLVFGLVTGYAPVAQSAPGGLKRKVLRKPIKFKPLSIQELAAMADKAAGRKGARGRRGKVTRKTKITFAPPKRKRKKGARGASQKKTMTLGEAERRINAEVQKRLAAAGIDLRTLKDGQTISAFEIDEKGLKASRGAAKKLNKGKKSPTIGRKIPIFMGKKGSRGAGKSAFKFVEGAHLKKKRGARGGAKKKSKWTKSYNKTPIDIGKKWLIAAKAKVKAEMYADHKSVKASALVDSHYWILDQKSQLFRAKVAFSGDNNKGTISGDASLKILGTDHSNLLSALKFKKTTKWAKKDVIKKSLDWSKSFSFDITVCDIKGKIGVKGEAGIEYEYDVRPLYISGRVKPYIRSKAFGEAGAHCLGVEAGIGGELTLINAEIEVGADVALLGDDSGLFVEHAAYGRWDYKNIMGGRIYGWADGWITLWKRVKGTLFKWHGFSDGGFFLRADQDRTYLSKKPSSKARGAAKKLHKEFYGARGSKKGKVSVKGVGKSIWACLKTHGNKYVGLAYDWKRPGPSINELDAKSGRCGKMQAVRISDALGKKLINGSAVFIETAPSYGPMGHKILTVNKKGAVSAYHMAPPTSPKKVKRPSTGKFILEIVGKKDMVPLELKDKIRLKSVQSGKYLVAENGGGGEVKANRKHAKTWETFSLKPTKKPSIKWTCKYGKRDGHHNCKIASLKKVKWPENIADCWLDYGSSSVRCLAVKADKYEAVGGSSIGSHRPQNRLGMGGKEGHNCGRARFVKRIGPRKGKLGSTRYKNPVADICSVMNLSKKKVLKFKPAKGTCTWRPPSFTPPWHNARIRKDSEAVNAVKRHLKFPPCMYRASAKYKSVTIGAEPR